MSGESTTIARPYAEALFDRALETGKLDLWADMLEMMAAVTADPEIAGLIANPRLTREQMTELLLDIGGSRLSDEGQNMVRLLVANDRLQVLPEIEQLFNSLKAEHEGVLDVTVVTAFELEPDQEAQLAKSLKQTLGRDVRISSEQDASLIGGVRIRAGDMVIDGSVAGQLSKLANELGI